jgi:hypothetical protein
MANNRGASLHPQTAFPSHIILKLKVAHRVLHATASIFPSTTVEGSQEEEQSVDSREHKRVCHQSHWYRQLLHVIIGCHAPKGLLILKNNIWCVYPVLKVVYFSDTYYLVSGTYSALQERACAGFTS